jgi:hypothetical protein
MGIEPEFFEGEPSNSEGCEPAAVVSDGIAQEIADRSRIGTDGEPAAPLATLRGWVVAGEQVTRLYPDPSWAVWVEISNAKIVRQVPGCERPQDDGRSLLWVIADARVTTCRVSTAATAADATPRTEEFMMASVWPRPKP